MIFQYISNKMQHYTVYFIWKLLYMFWAIPSPIIRNAKQLYLQHLVFVTPHCYLLVADHFDSRSLGLLAPLIHGMITYIQEPLEIGRRGSMGRRLNGNTLAAVNGHLRPLRESVAYVRAVDVGVPPTVIS